MPSIEDQRREPTASPSWATNVGVARSMRSNRRRDTQPELAVRRLVHRAGYRFRVDYAPGTNRRRRADIVFTRLKVAIFIDGCFWHVCPAHATVPKSNATYWVPKLESNRLRDEETNAQLRSEGWTVMRFWEHVPAIDIASEIIETASERRRSFGL